jgi:site-specific DNA recombinase
VPLVERRVERLYRTLHIAAEVKAQIRQELREELTNRAALIEQEAERHERTLKKIEAKQEKLVQLYYQDLVTMDVFEREQAKLKAEAKAAQRLRRVALMQTQDVEKALDEALVRIERTHQSYLEATPQERRIMNRAIFVRIEVGEEDGKITGTALTPTYKAIAAWQPSLGQPHAASADAQDQNGACSALVRPSSGDADFRRTERR